MSENGEKMVKLCPFSIKDCNTDLTKFQWLLLPVSSTAKIRAESAGKIIIEHPQKTMIAIIIGHDIILIYSLHMYYFFQLSLLFSL